MSTIVGQGLKSRLLRRTLAHALGECGLGETTGVWTSAQARAAGLSADQVRGRIARGEWQRLHRGVYADGGYVPDARMRAAAAVLACGRDGAVAAGRTAARVWGIPLVDDHDPATRRWEHRLDDVAVARGRGASSTLRTRALTLTAADVVEKQDVPVLTPVRTLVDLALVLRPDALVCAVDHALHRGLVSADDLAAATSARRWSRGARALRSALALSDPAAESPHETLTRLVVLPVLPGLRSQVPVHDPHGRLVARLDLGDPRLKLAVESDGAAFHAGRAAQDRARDARTGWTVERVTWFDTRCRPAELRRRVLATAAELERRAA